MRSFSSDWKLRLAAWRQLKYDFQVQPLPDLWPAVLEQLSALVFGHLNRRLFDGADEHCPEAEGRHLAEAAYLEEKAREILLYWLSSEEAVSGYRLEYCLASLQHFENCPACRREAGEHIRHVLELAAGVKRLVSLLRSS